MAAAPGVPAPDPVVGCGTLDFTCRAGEAVAGALTDGFAVAARAVGDAVGSVLTSVSTMWIDIGTPNLSSNGGQPSDTVAFLQGSLFWYMSAAAVLAVTIGGARMAWERRSQPGTDVLRALVTLAVVSGSGLAVIGLAVAAADSFAQWIIGESTVGTDFGQNLGAYLLSPLVTPTAAGDAQPALLVIFLGVAGIITSVVQIILMIVRSGMLVILAGIFPLAASFTTFETGRTWFRRCVAWLLAFILYKPAAAIVYATAFRLAGADVFGARGGLLDVLVGLTMMVLAILALPALMRFVTPLVATLSSGGGGGATAAMGALAALPTGAALLRGGGRGGTGPTGASGPGGPAGPGPAGAGPAGASSGGPGAAGGPRPGPAASGGASGSTPSGAGGAGAGAGGVASGAGGGAAGGAAASGGAAAGGAAAAGPAAAAAVGLLQAGSAATGATRRAADDSVGKD